MSVHWRIGWPAIVLCISMCGCMQSDVESGPSYAELLVIYNAELESLDRLETKRDELVKEYAAATAPTFDPLKDIEGLLKSAKELKDSTNLDTKSDPNEVLDELAADSEEAQEIAGQLLEGLLAGESKASPQPTPEEAVAITEQKTAFDAKLAALDEEISKQKERVERARQARDVAEAKSQSSE